MDHCATQQLLLDRAIAQLAIRIDRLHNPDNRMRFSGEAAGRPTLAIRSADLTFITRDLAVRDTLMRPMNIPARTDR